MRKYLASVFLLVLFMTANAQKEERSDSTIVVLDIKTDSSGKITGVLFVKEESYNYTEEDINFFKKLIDTTAFKGKVKFLEKSRVTIDSLGKRTLDNSIIIKGESKSEYFSEDYYNKRKSNTTNSRSR